MASLRGKVPLKAPLEICWSEATDAIASPDGVQVGERIALGANEELHVRRHHGGVRKVDGGDDGAIDVVVARSADDADDLTRGGALRRGGLEVILTCEIGNA